MRTAPFMSTKCIQNPLCSGFNSSEEASLSHLCGRGRPKTKTKTKKRSLSLQVESIFCILSKLFLFFSIFVTNFQCFDLNILHFHIYLFRRVKALNAFTENTLFLSAILFSPLSLCPFFSLLCMFNFLPPFRLAFFSTSHFGHPVFAPLYICLIPPL